MATRAHSATDAFASSGKNIPISTRVAVAPPSPIIQVLSRFSRSELEGLISVAIDLLDLADGDVEREDDDPAGGNVEDEGERLEQQLFALQVAA